MGREIRRVTPHWEHPRFTKDDARDSRDVGQYKSLYNQDYESASAEWIDGFDAWRKGEHKSQPCDYCKHFWEYSNPPDVELYRPKFEKEPTWYQVYETVSEGSPVTPPFATQDELIDYLVNNGDEWDERRGEGGWSRENAEAFVARGHAMSMMVISGPSGAEIKMPRDGS